MTIYRVYKLTCKPTGQVYIGATEKSSQERFMRHVYQSNWKPTTTLHEAIREHGQDAFIVETLETHEDRDYVFNTLEPKYIAEYDSKNNGLNSTDGGEGIHGCSIPSNGMLGKKHSPESKAKMSTSQQKRVLSDDARRRISEGSKNRVYTPEIREKISKALTGRKRSKEECEAISRGQKGIRPSEEAKEKMRKAKEVHLYEVIRPDGTVETTSNMTTYSNNNNLNPKCLSNVLNGIQKQHKGYTIRKIS